MTGGKKKGEKGKRWRYRYHCLREANRECIKMTSEPTGRTETAQQVGQKKIEGDNSPALKEEK